MFPIANTVYSQLSGSQYKVLIRLDSQEKRDFYIAETIKNNWTVRQLERHKLTQQDVGQLQMYVNFYDRNEKKDYENPTIGILLCAEKIMLL